MKCYNFNYLYFNYLPKFASEFLPLGTLFLVVMRKGSPVPITVPNSEAHVSPLQHANAPFQMQRAFNIQFVNLLSAKIIFTTFRQTLPSIPMDSHELRYSLSKSIGRSPLPISSR